MRVFSEWIVLIFKLFYFLLPIFAFSHLSSADLRFEVIPNTITHGLTDPKKVYVLRWIAGRHAGVPEFVPPYTIAL